MLRSVALLMLSSAKAVSAFALHSSSRFGFAASAFSTTTALAAAKPFGVVVKATIEPDRMDEFMSMIENNAIQSRKEPGCLRFDVLRDQETPNQFIFYEVYRNSDAVDFHKTQDHYNAWATFKENGGVIESISYKVDGEFMT